MGRFVSLGRDAAGRLIPSGRKATEAAGRARGVADRMAYYNRKGRPEAVNIAAQGVAPEFARVKREIRSLRNRSVAVGAGYGALAAGGGTAAVIAGRDRVGKADVNRPFDPWIEQHATPAEKAMLMRERLKTAEQAAAKKAPAAPKPGKLARVPKGKVGLGIAGGLGIAAGLTGGAVAGSRQNVDKAFTGRLVPKSMLMRKPGVRRSYIGTSVTGRKFTVRGTTR